jgi:hypothetical protein
MPRSTHLAALAFAFALLAPPARADDTLPAGWIAGGPAAPMAPPPPPGGLSRAALQLDLSPVRPALTAVALSLADFDTVDVGPAPTWAEVAASNADPPGEAPTDLFVAPRCRRVSVTGHSVGSVTLGWDTEGIGPWSSGGVELYGPGALADGHHLYQRLEWQTLDRLPDGTLRFTETVARFHVLTCKATVARRFSTIVRPILGGRAYLFRTRCAACAPAERDVVHVLTGGGWGTVPYARHAVSLAPGGASGFRTRVATVRLRKLAEVTGRPLPDPPGGKEAVIGVEAAQALGEKAPTLIAYTFDELPRSWGF